MTGHNTIDPRTVSDFISLNSIKLAPEMSRITSRLRFNIKQPAIRHIRELLSSVLSKTEPEAVYKNCRITWIAANSLVIDGVQFDYPLLRINLSQASLIFPFMITAGRKIESVSSSTDDPRDGYCLDIIKDLVLEEIFKSLESNMMQKHHLPYLWSLIPGEMEAWPVSGQKGLFRLLGNITEAAGVTLQSDYSLSPKFSRSGIFFYTETEFEGCQVCAKEPCMMRRAQFNAQLARQKGLKIRKVCGKDTA